MKRLSVSPAIPQTPGVLRARIQLRVELARDLNPETLDYLLAHQRIAELERELAKLEGHR
jgi:hypothetical protein